MRFAIVACFLIFGSAPLWAQPKAAQPKAAQTRPKTQLTAPPHLETSSSYIWPEFKTSWGISSKMYEKTQSFYKKNLGKIKNKRYVTIIDLKQHSSKKRFLLLDLETGKVEDHHTAHGRGSDPDGDGYATEFSNMPSSKQSSLGFYTTLGTYFGQHGYSLRLKGHEATNSKAEERDIVIHGAKYINTKKNYAGRSWGCPSLDPSVSKSIIDKIKGGSLLYIGLSEEARKDGLPLKALND